MLFQQGRELIAGGLTVVACHGGADVFLVLHQARSSGGGIRLIAHCGNDVVASPDHVIGPELPHVLVERGRWRHGRRLCLHKAGWQQRHERECPDNVFHEASSEC